jgi:hypothetical protein
LGSGGSTYDARVSTPSEVREAEQLPRFGALRPVPPAETLAMLTGAAPGTDWTAARIGDDRGYPNGGLWRVEADRRRPDGPAAVFVKRTGAAYLGTFRVWRLRADPTDPQWWGREAEFYLSELATAGWTDEVRVARCHVDDHDGCRDLWLEEIADIPAPLQVCRRAVAGLARWQVAHAASDHPWLSDDWIATHLGRYQLDNERTLAHPAWPAAIERGLDPAIRELVAARVIDPAEIARLLAEFPQALTNHDFHNANLGTVGDQVVIIDWSYVGRGPIGHDVGHLALSLDPAGSVDPAEAWHTLESAYCEALAAAGWSGDLDLVRRSMALSNQLRLGWWIDTVLNSADKITDAELAVQSRILTFLGELR